MTKSEIETIENIIARLKAPNCGCSHGPGTNAKIQQAGLRTETPEGESRMSEVAVVSRIYLDTWIIPALSMILPGDGRNPALALSMSRR